MIYIKVNDTNMIKKRQKARNWKKPEPRFTMNVSSFPCFRSTLDALSLF